MNHASGPERDENNTETLVCKEKENGSLNAEVGKRNGAEFGIRIEKRNLSEI
jgi:hypothetical protein